MAKCGWQRRSEVIPKRTRAQRDRRGRRRTRSCVCARARVRLRERGRLRPCHEATFPRRRARAARAARRARALAKVNAFVSRHGFAFSPPTILEQQAQEQRVLEVLDSLRRLLDSPQPQRILSHVRLDSTHGTSRTAMLADERKQRCAAAEKARCVRPCARPFLLLRPPLTRRKSQPFCAKQLCDLHRHFRPFSRRKAAEATASFTLPRASFGSRCRQLRLVSLAIWSEELCALR